MTKTPLNSVQPDMGGSPGWDRTHLETLLTLETDPQGRLLSRHAEVNSNGAIFGGQLIGQAVSAAAEGLPETWLAHSLQLNFLSPGLTDQALIFNVRRLLDGRNFVSQHVLASQGERMVFSANVSFHRGEPGPEFAQPMPAELADPESLPNLHDLVLAYGDQMQLSDELRAHVGSSPAVELRPLQGRHFLLEREASGRLLYWIRVRQPLSDAPRLHQAALGFLSDYWFPMTSLAPHVGNKVATGLYIASLNHAIWFHAPLRADDWLLMDAQTQATGNGRGLVQARVYERKGALVASVAQESLFRGWVNDPAGGLTAPYASRPPT